MAKSDISWAEAKPEPQVPSAPSPRWLSWLAAGLILLVLAFVSHTSGRVAQQIRQQMRHWMTVNVEPSGLKQEALHWVDGVGEKLSRPKAHVTAANPAWLAPVAKARIGETFGWHGQGSRAFFQPDVVLKVTPKSAVLAGVKGRMFDTNHQRVRFSAQGYQIVMFPLESARLTKGQALLPTTRLGSTAAATLTIEVTRDGYPVNPLLTALYGTKWLDH